MGWRSLRIRMLERLLFTFRDVTRLFVLVHLDQLIQCDIDDDILEENNELLILVSYLNRVLRGIQLSRYLTNRIYRKGILNIFKEDLSTECDWCWMNDDDFLCKYRVTRDQLDRVTNLLSEDTVFARPERGYPKMPVKHQIMIWLHFVGHEAQSNSTQFETFKNLKGMCKKAHNRSVKALNNIRDDYICWPDPEERTNIAARIEKVFHKPNCPVMQDGTLLRLGIEPECDDAAHYHGRKFTYSITVNVINDNEQRIRAYHVGHPGSTHDKRVWRNMKQHRDLESYFSENKFIMCDTAYKPSWFCAPALKCVVGDGLQRHPHKTLFNTVLAKPWVVCEHTMGLWKGWFCWLRNIRMKITSEKDSLRWILHYIDSTIVVHNMLIEWRVAEDRKGCGMNQWLLTLPHLIMLVVLQKLLRE